MFSHAQVWYCLLLQVAVGALLGVVTGYLLGITWHGFGMPSWRSIWSWCFAQRQKTRDSVCCVAKQCLKSLVAQLSHGWTSRVVPYQRPRNARRVTTHCFLKPFYTTDMSTKLLVASVSVAWRPKDYLVLACCNCTSRIGKFVETLRQWLV